jgi:MGT family glycosyltransferase
MSQRKSYLFVTWEGGGNVPPVLGAAHRLVQRGHEVRVLTEPCLRAAVEAIGARFVPFTEHFVRTDRQAELLTDWKAGSPTAALASTLDAVIFGPAAATASAVARAIDAEPVDVLVADWMMPAAIAVGEARGLPTAVLLHCINMLPGPGRPPGPMFPARGALGRLRDRILWFLFERIVARHSAAYTEVRRSLGLAPLATPFQQYARADRLLVQTCAEFDFLATPEPDNVAYVGPVLDEPDWLDRASWQSPWPEDDPRPLVVVSLSTTFQNQRDVLQAAMTALGRLDVRGLATLGPAMATASFDVPPNVVAVASAPHGLVFERAAALITHCGHGSTMRALSRGVPLVALPMGRDQDGTATRIVHRGLGLKPRRTPAAIAEAVRRVVGEPAFRAASARMAEHIRRDAEADRLIAELEAIAAPEKAGRRGGPVADERERAIVSPR